jgi:molybdopterin-guanine dinucleotide biosynthesis protein A
MAGLHVVLSSNPAPLVAVLAVDMPWLSAPWFTWLTAFCRPGRGAMATHEDVCEPLAAIYPAEALGEVVARLERRETSVQRLAFSLAAQDRLALVPIPARLRGGELSLNEPVTGPHLLSHPE